MRDYFYKCAWYVCRYAQAAGVEVIAVSYTHLIPQINQSLSSVRCNAFNIIKINPVSHRRQ